MTAPMTSILFGVAYIAIAFIPDSGGTFWFVFNTLFITVGIALVGLGIACGVKS